MRNFLEEFKKHAPMLIVLALMASVVLGGALTKSITDAKAAGSDSLIFDVCATVFTNISNMSFLGGMFSDFLLFLQITFWIFVAVFGIYIFGIDLID